jgi:hypothetical protein
MPKRGSAGLRVLLLGALVFLFFNILALGLSLIFPEKISEDFLQRVRDTRSNSTVRRPYYMNFIKVAAKDEIMFRKQRQMLIEWLLEKNKGVDFRQTADFSGLKSLPDRELTIFDYDAVSVFVEKQLSFLQDRLTQGRVDQDFIRNFSLLWRVIQLAENQYDTRPHTILNIKTILFGLQWKNRIMVVFAEALSLKPEMRAQLMVAFQDLSAYDLDVTDFYDRGFGEIKRLCLLALLEKERFSEFTNPVNWWSRFRNRQVWKSFLQLENIFDGWAAFYKLQVEKTALPGSSLAVLREKIVSDLHKNRQMLFIRSLFWWPTWRDFMAMGQAITLINQFSFSAELLEDLDKKWQGFGKKKKEIGT